MDGGYTSRRIGDIAASISKVPVIDIPANRNGNKKEMEPCKAERYKAWTTVERTNSELKECCLLAKRCSKKGGYIPDRVLYPAAGYKEDFGKTQG